MILQHLDRFRQVDLLLPQAEIIEIPLTSRRVHLVCVATEEVLPYLQVLLHELVDYLAVPVLLFVQVDELHLSADESPVLPLYVSSLIALVDQGLQFLADSTLVGGNTNLHFPPL